MSQDKQDKTGGGGKKAAAVQETLQMSAEEVRALHEELNALSDPGPVPADAPAPRAAPLPPPSEPSAAAPAPAPAVATSQVLGPLQSTVKQVFGGIGALFVLGALVLTLLPHLQGMRERWIVTLMFALNLVAYLMVAPGFAAAHLRTNGTATLAGVFAYMAAMSQVLALIANDGMRGDTAQAFMAVGMLGPPTFWVFCGLWSLTASRGLGGGLAVSLGLTALLGGLAVAAAWVMSPLMLGTLRRMDDDLFIALFLGGLALLAVAAILLTVAFFAPLRRPLPTG